MSWLFRSGAGMLLSLLGILLLTRRIGSSAYGVYAGGLGILVFLQALAQWGVSTYLLRATTRTSNAPPLSLKR